MSFAPWVPSRSRDLSRIFKLADLQDGQIFYDLGCGDARMVIAAARAYHVKSLGIEIVPPLYFWAKFRQWLNRDLLINIKFGSLFKADLSDANVVYLFGLPKNVSGRLKTKLEKELKPGSRVVSYAFHIEGWTPAQVDQKDKSQIAIYVYQR